MTLIPLRKITDTRRRTNGWRYPLVGGTRQRHFAGTHFRPRKLPETAATPTSRVHAVLARLLVASATQANPRIGLCRIARKAEGGTDIVYLTAKCSASHDTH